MSNTEHIAKCHSCRCFFSYKEEDALCKPSEIYGVQIVYVSCPYCKKDFVIGEKDE